MDVKNNIKDFNDIADWAKDAVERVVKEGLMIGTDEGLFLPRAAITRQEMAVLVCRLLDAIDKHLVK